MRHVASMKNLSLFAFKALIPAFSASNSSSIFASSSQISRFTSMRVSILNPSSSFFKVQEQIDAARKDYEEHDESILDGNSLESKEN